MAVSKGVQKAKPFEPITFTVSGTTYKYADLEHFEIKPLKQRKIGGFGGVQYTYQVKSREEQILFQDRIANAAADVADEFGDEHHIHLAICKDAGHI